MRAYCLLVVVIISCCCCLSWRITTGAASLSSQENGQVESLEELGEGLSRFKRKSRNTSQLPEFSAPIGNVSAVEGRDVRLVCTVEHLGQYQVAWLKEETKTILSIDTNIITTNYRIFLIPDEEERKWVLHIKDVQSSDRGFYQCQVNTVPMRSSSGYLEVVVPPTIIESQSSQVADVTEHANISIQCKANGHPRASISWRRDDGLPIRLNGRFNFTANHDLLSLPASSGGNFDDNNNNNNNQHTSVSQLDDVKSDKLTLYDVDRTMAGIYVCTASNGIPSQVSKRIPLYVKFAPKVSVNNKYISVSLGDQLEVDCIIEAFPKANSYWSKKPPSGVAPFSLEQRKGISAASRWYQLMLSSEAENRGALSPPKGAIGEIERARSSSSKSETPSGHQWLSSDNFTLIDKAKNGLTDDERPPMSHYSHRHNRIKFRHTVEQQQGGQAAANSELFDSFSGEDNGSLRKLFQNSHSSSEPSKAGSNINKAYMSVKQTALNSFTYKLKLTVAQMQPDDYGQYTCISTNTLGNSEAHVIVTRADKSGQSSEVNSNLGSNGERDDSIDSLNSETAKQQNRQQTSSLRRSSNGNHVYDENYLQAIKARKNNVPGNSHQKLKLRQSSERNGTVRSRQFDSRGSIIILLIFAISSRVIYNLIG